MTDLLGVEPKARRQPKQEVIAPVREMTIVEMASQIMRLAADPAFDVEKTKALDEMRKGLQAEQAKREYAMAMNLAQGEIEPVARDTFNDQTKSWYAKLETVDEAIRPIYTRHGFSVRYDNVRPFVEGNIRIEVVGTHVGGHEERVGREAPPDTTGPKGTPTKTSLQGQASSDTLLRRYALCALFNVPYAMKGMDDDGNGGPCNEEQIKHLRRLLGLLQKVKPHVTEDKVCEYLKVDKMEALPRSKYVQARTMFENSMASEPPKNADLPS